MINNEIKRVDEILYRCFKNIVLISSLTPININSEKQKFLLNKKRNPSFEYNKPKKEIFDIEKKLINLKIPESELKELFEKRRKEFLKQIKIIKNLNKNPSKTRELSSELYGWPNKKTIEYSKKILKETITKSEVYEITSEKIFNKLNKKLNKIGLFEWEVLYFNGKITQTTSNKKIFVPGNKVFSKLDAKRLLVHEVETHAIRFQNAFSQNLKIFVYGFPGFLETEEGLAVFIEEKTKNKTKASFRNYAGRVIAIECLKDEMDFRDCFNELKKHGFLDEEAWNLTFRVYRGGGFVKDHIYLQGYLIIKEFFKNNGNLKKLFIGKIGINDLKLIEKLEEKNLINDDLIYPSLIKRL